MADATASDGIGGGLPPQDAGNSGFVLTTTTTNNLSNASWESAATASLPSQVGNTGKFLTTNGTVASWGAAGGGVTTVGAFGSTPTANAMSISGVTLTGQPADGTHPGFLTSGTQAIGGAKTFTLAPTAPGLNGSGTGAATGIILDTPAIGTGLVFQLMKNGFEVLHCDNTGAWVFYNAGSVSLGQLIMNNVGVTTVLDGSGAAVGAGIKLKSPDGTTYTLSIANGGTTHVV